MTSSSLIPRARFAALPTPVEPLPRLSQALGSGPRLLVKRDDLTGLAFGGNKTRKLEFVLAEAQANGARTLVTVGAAQSNHCRQTAALAARAGLDCILVLSGEPEEQPTGNLLLDELFGAEIVWTTRAGRASALQQAFEDAWAAGRRPYLIPLGASNAVGALGYEAAFQEFLNQGVPADWIVVASSSGGTQAGLVLGSRRAGWPGRAGVQPALTDPKRVRVLGISIDEPQAELQRMVAGMAAAAADRLGEKLAIRPEEILVNADYLGEGYGVMGEPEREAIRLFARCEGLLLDPVYTARAAAGMIDLIRKGFFQPGETVLFWHTGGTPALFANKYAKGLT
jgi:D-cysteine desulfhydrase family pyridoxal phosphate-dependent enzyme